MTMSAFWVYSSILGVWLWISVTVASVPLALIRILIGRPTILLRPITTHFFPLVSILYLSKSCIIPNGVAGRRESISKAIFPKFSGWKPSTSFLGSIAMMIFSWSMPFGRGSCTMNPSISSFSFSFFISSKSSFSQIVSGNFSSDEVNPTSLQSLTLLFT